MKKIIALLFLVGTMVQVAPADPGSYDDGWQVIEAPTSSGVVNSTYGRGRVRAIYASSDTANYGAWFVLLDTPGVATSLTEGAFASAIYRSPAIGFPLISLGTSPAINPTYKVFEYGPDGVVFSSGIYVYKSAASSGQARRVFLEIRR